jgi:hypothetical protein
VAARERRTQGDRDRDLLERGERREARGERREAPAEAMPSSFQSLLLGLGLLVGHATAQGFWHNCTRWTLGWEDGTVYRRFMVAECGDGGEKTRASFLPLNDCITNKEGKMVPTKK